MKVFRVLVLGEHFKLDYSGNQGYMGFYSTRFITAANSDVASAAAIEAVRLDPRLDGLAINAVDDPPRLSIEEIEELTDLSIPEAKPGFVLFEDETPAQENEVGPPPYLVIRKDVAFWAEHRPLGKWSATPQAFNNGCYRNACIYDTSGRLWRIGHSELDKAPTLLNRIMPWRQLRVRIELDPYVEPNVADVAAEIAAILESGTSFSERLCHNPADILRGLGNAATPKERIEQMANYE
ncbi:hypothetical protein [Cyanobium sp. NIES-981]|uniref:hypothetical protein n=1 Tax=Cyanobium sp. NIES-981 TaxID=1851505 RepID=UPI0007DCC9BF|nr:hypothetical protein [Cyanobium sp. NIES-981]SBO41985.1 protein of unknown function [Cyanobium sp. NIES-981]